ncbi:MAG TPA: DUF488 domain-containing protein [Candidatus Enterousia intestinigallinarum]|uniref:DUF488 domain-containing protein n=1 Tax=Candidatus Enterousia intestinigallinarum TaxID=2840790 RepID=A0A9D1FG49_9PROT|nr:DUF488 domain-containing protein [Candidatus Enterousia intestinigallinarum]
MPKIFKIGFSGKSPDAFMDVLNAVRVRTVWDIRLWRTSIHVPFYSGDSLATALGPRYEYHPEFAPTTEILAGYKNGTFSWADYEKMYRELLATRRPTDGLAPDDIDRICLLCTEKSALQCHRGLTAEYIATQFPDVEIVHL